MEVGGRESPGIAKWDLGDSPSDAPAVVLGVEQEVGADDRDADGDDREDDEDEQHEAEHVVDLVRPERREDEVPGAATDNGRRVRAGPGRTRAAANA